MSITNGLVEILRCLETKSSVRLLESDRLEQLNAAIRQKLVFNRNGDLVEQPLEAGLINEEESWLYPVYDGIPAMLREQSIANQWLEHDT